MGLHPAVYLMGRDPIPRRRSYARADMRPPGATGYHPRFPAAVPVRGAGWSRVTQPFATRFHPEVGAVRLACVRRAASVHPEPGSNSPSRAPEGAPGARPAPAGLNADRIPFRLGDVLDDGEDISSSLYWFECIATFCSGDGSRHLPSERALAITRSCASRYPVPKVRAGAALARPRGKEI